jgi:hypothetical protein
MRRCLFCGSETFVLLTSVECTNPSCRHYRASTESVTVRASSSQYPPTTLGKRRESTRIRGRATSPLN